MQIETRRIDFLADLDNVSKADFNPASKADLDNVSRRIDFLA